MKPAPCSSPRGFPLAEWLVEQGIGEERAVLVEGGEAVAARLRWPGGLEAGLIADARLITRIAGSGRGTARFGDGQEALVDGLPGDASEGAVIRLRISRARIAETGRHKRAQARPSNEPPRSAERLAGRIVQRFPAGLWEDVVADSQSGAVTFAGGMLNFSATPAMTLIDIDGELGPAALALAAIPTLCRSIRRLDLGGSIGIDFPTLAARTDRKAADLALGKALDGWPHERTAMNGFGFVQLVSRLERPSLLQRWQFERSAAAARLLLRRAELVSAPGTLLLCAAPSVRQAVSPAWEEELHRRTGRSIEWREDRALAPEAAFAQALGG